MNQIPLYARVRLWVSVPILVTTAVLKAVTAWDTSRGLPNEDPVFSFLATRHLFALVAGLEFSVVLLLLSNFPQKTKATALFAITTSFLLYRASMIMLFSNAVCGCAGTLALFSSNVSKAVELSLSTYASITWLALATFFFCPQAPVSQENEG